MNKGRGGRSGMAWAKRRAQRVIADDVHAQVRPLAGGERIIDKFWVTCDGRLVHQGPYVTHQEYALDFLRKNEGFAVTHDRNRDRLRAEAALLARGWLRGQVYDVDGLGLQGKPRAVKAHGAVALSLVPRPRRLYIQSWPRVSRCDYFGAEALDRLGWDRLAAHRRKGSCC